MRLLTYETMSENIDMTDATYCKAEDTRGRKPAPIFDLKNRRRFSTPKTDMAEKNDDDAVAAAIMHLGSCK